MGNKKKGSNAKSYTKAQLAATKGCRAPGGGRTNLFSQMWTQVARWHHEHRLLNHPVDKNDCFLEFLEVCKLEIAAWKIIKSKGKLTDVAEK